jgi:hypothetical protein
MFLGHRTFLKRGQPGGQAVRIRDKMSHGHATRGFTPWFSELSWKGGRLPYGCADEERIPEAVSQCKILTAPSSRCFPTLVLLIGSFHGSAIDAQ